MIRTSIIMPMYNVANTIKPCLDALHAQDAVDNYEIICVDNNSTDATIKHVEEYSKVRLLHETKQGAYAARNTGAAAANGESLIFIDPDCVAEACWLSAHLRSLERSCTKVSLGRVRHGKNDGTLGLLGEYDHARQVVTFQSKAVDHYFGYTNNLAITRDAWEKVGPFTERRRGADTVLVQNTVKQFGPRSVRYQPLACVRHLEMDSIRTFWKKMLIYGRSSRLFRDFATPAPPTWDIRMKSRALACDRANAGIIGRIKLSATLGIGIAAWQWGYRCGLGVQTQDTSIAHDSVNAAPKGAEA